MIGIDGQGGKDKLQVKLISWNVRGLNGPVKRAKVFQHLKLHRADIVFLPEPTHSTRMYIIPTQG